MGEGVSLGLDFLAVEKVHKRAVCINTDFFIRQQLAVSLRFLSPRRHLDVARLARIEAHAFIAPYHLRLRLIKIDIAYVFLLPCILDAKGDGVHRPVVFKKCLTRISHLQVHLRIILHSQLSALHLDTDVIPLRVWKHVLDSRFLTSFKHRHHAVFAVRQRIGQYHAEITSCYQVHHISLNPIPASPKHTVDMVTLQQCIAVSPLVEGGAGSTANIEVDP